MRKAGIGLIVCIAAVLLTGCRQKYEGSRLIVSHIRVSIEGSNATLYQEYTAGENIRQILGAIRLVGEQSKPVKDPDTLDAQCYRIVLTHIDGSQHIVYTKEDRYIRQGDSPWRQAQPEGIARLHRLLTVLREGEHSS